MIQTELAARVSIVGIACQGVLRTESSTERAEKDQTSRNDVIAHQRKIVG